MSLFSVMNRKYSQQHPEDIFAHSTKWEAVYRTAPVGLAFLSTDCRYLMINQHLTEICGISVEDHLGRSVRETVPQVADQVEGIVETILRTGEPITGIEVNGQRPDGSNAERVWITYWYPLKTEEGVIAGINVAAKEITERKRAEAELAASQDELRRLNETLAERVEAQAQERDRIWKLSQDLLVVSDTNGVILNVNPAWSAALGWAADELIGKSGEWLVHPSDRERSLAERSSLAAGRKTPHLEIRILCKDGSYRWLSWSAVPDRGLIYATARDITSLKRAEEQLDDLRHQLADSARQTTMGAMAASIAHEINQPLAAIRANASASLRWLRREDPDLIEAQAALDNIERDCQRVNEVIASVRALFGKRSGEKSRVDLRLLVEEVLILSKSELAVHQITLHNHELEDLPPVMGERVSMQQVILNLVVNAIEAMHSVDDRERILTLKSTVEQARIILTIEDTGNGIEPDHVNRIFEPFFTTKSSGMGLGLSICSSIVEEHGGSLRAEARIPYGTAFRLTLPTAT